MSEEKQEFKKLKMFRKKITALKKKEKIVDDQPNLTIRKQQTGFEIVSVVASKDL